MVFRAQCMCGDPAQSLSCSMPAAKPNMSSAGPYRVVLQHCCSMTLASLIAVSAGSHAHLIESTSRCTKPMLPLMAALPQGCTPLFAAVLSRTTNASGRCHRCLQALTHITIFSTLLSMSSMVFDGRYCTTSSLQHEAPHARITDGVRGRSISMLPSTRGLSIGAGYVADIPVAFSGLLCDDLHDFALHVFTNLLLFVTPLF